MFGVSIGYLSAINSASCDLWSASRVALTEEVSSRAISWMATLPIMKAITTKDSSFSFLSPRSNQMIAPVATNRESWIIGLPISNQYSKPLIEAIFMMVKTNAPARLTNSRNEEYLARNTGMITTSTKETLKQATRTAITSSKERISWLASK